MKILVVGNVIKDVYLNIDERTENIEADSRQIDWLDLSFDASEHHFFNRTSNFGGAAITLEVLQKMGLETAISETDFHFDATGPVPTAPVSTHRYILTTENGVTYFTPSIAEKSLFATPTEPIDYLYIDRSANLTPQVVDRINAYLSYAKDVKLILYLKDQTNLILTGLIRRASLIFLEKPPKRPEYQTALTSMPSVLKDFPKDRIITIAEDHLAYQSIREDVSIERINTLTHLSAYSIISATILGGFILGKTVEYSLRMARVNVEHSTLSSTLNYAELENLVLHASKGNLELVAKSLMLKGKGILAADESGGSIKKQFEKLHIPNDFRHRHAYRDIFLTLDDLNQYVNGVILFDETARDHTSAGQTYPDYLTGHRIIPGIKVDQGLVPFNNSSETYTDGLDSLPARLREYYQMGLRFAKWRACFNITLGENGQILTPTEDAIRENCRRLAEFAKDCQTFGLVPIVEPEVSYDGNYPIELCATVTGVVLDNLFEALRAYEVNLRACILKCNMILAGKAYDEPSTPDEVAHATSEVLRAHVPEDLAGVVFLSGGQTPDQATKNLAAIIASGPYPWPISFSFARALKEPSLDLWQGADNNLEKARQAFLDRLIANTIVL
ncbi:fructose-bisphosphate aldolase class I [Candidatus Saccharibacteria bacterium]|nr:fructose-bisphosphate aldolase class I [Candidatus Saccharibacteria bacterium]